MTIPETPLTRVRVKDVMHTGILTTDPGTPLRVLARLMAQQRVHAVAVANPDHARRAWGIVTDLDVAAAAADHTNETAGEAGKHAAPTISATDSLRRPARQRPDPAL